MSRLSFRKLCTAAAAAALVAMTAPAASQGTIRIGEINSYKAQPAFLEPYKKGMQLAVDEINASGGVNGRQLELITRDDNANPGDAVRLAEELVSREKVDVLTGSFLSHIGLALTDFAKQKKVFFLAGEPLTDKIVWQNGNRYTFRLRPSTYMQVAMLMPDAAALMKKRCSRPRSPTSSSSRSRRRRSARSTREASCRRSPTRSPTRSSTCCSAPTSRSSCARATRAACSRDAKW
jgi:hypothetical protein